MIRTLLKNVKLFLIDIDGVVFKGNTLIENAEDAVNILQRNGVRTIFVTNNSTRSRNDLVHRLRAAGINVDSEDILTTAYCATQYVLALGLETTYIIGEKGLFEEFMAAGLTIVSENFERCDAVVVGMDRNYNYRKLATAFKFIQTNAKFIATNTDATLPTERGEIPGAGAMVSSLEGCTQKKPIVIGKPNTYLMKLALERAKLPVKDCVVVGDRPETDIAMARKGGCLGIIVLTGVTNKKRRNEYPIHQKPDLIYSSLLELSKEYEKHR